MLQVSWNLEINNDISAIRNLNIVKCLGYWNIIREIQCGESHFCILQKLKRSSPLVDKQTGSDDDGSFLAQENFFMVQMHGYIHIVLFS